MKENDIQAQILDWLSYKKGIYFWRSNNLPVFEKDRGVYRRLPKYTPRGLPDIMVVGKGGKFIAIEVKAPKKYLSKDQKAVRDSIEEAGGTYILARSIDDIKNRL